MHGIGDVGAPRALSAPGAAGSGHLGRQGQGFRGHQRHRDQLGAARHDCVAIYIYFYKPFSGIYVCVTDIEGSSKDKSSLPYLSHLSLEPLKLSSNLILAVLWTFMDTFG